MSSDYLWLNSLFLGITALVVIVLRNRFRLAIEWRVLLLLLGLTAIFDSAIVGFGIVAYHPEHMLGISIGKAPIEDFAYAIAAALVMPALWRTLRELYHD